MMMRATMLAAFAVALSACGGMRAIAPIVAPSESRIPGRGLEYLVGEGDTLYSIAWRYGLDYRSLARANAIVDPYTIFPGQRIVVPESDDDAGTGLRPADVAEPNRPPEVVTRGLDEEAAPTREKLENDARQSARAPRVVTPARSAPRSDAAAEKSPPKQSTPSPPKKKKTKVIVRSESPATASAASAKTTTWSWPTRGKLIGGFTRGGGKGIDVAGEFEQPIVASAAGKVVYAGGGLIGYGKLIIIKHDSRFLSAYAHNEKLHVKEGEAVQSGQHIADMGRSGSNRVKLHFEIRRDGKPVDPLRFLPK